jgi:hypothetical protein
LLLGASAVFQESTTFLILVDVKIAVRVNPDRMPAIALSGASRTLPARDHCSIDRQDGDLGVVLRHFVELV